MTETDLYDIKWTTPHCVLVLRLIGLTFDVCDTYEHKNGKTKKEMDYYGIEKTPNLLEIASYVYFPASFLAGPQFPYHLYERFMNKEFAKYVSAVLCVSRCIKVGLGCLESSLLLTRCYYHRSSQWIHGCKSHFVAYCDLLIM